jgi:hypothetical protein
MSYWELLAYKQSTFVRSNIFIKKYHTSNILLVYIILLVDRNKLRYGIGRNEGKRRED